MFNTCGMELCFRNACPNIKNMHLKATSFSVTCTILNRAEFGTVCTKGPLKIVHDNSQFVFSMRRWSWTEKFASCRAK